MEDKTTKQQQHEYLVNFVALKLIRMSKQLNELEHKFIKGKLFFTKEDEKKGSQMYVEHFRKIAEEIISLVREYIT